MDLTGDPVSRGAPALDRPEAIANVPSEPRDGTSRWRSGRAAGHTSPGRLDCRVQSRVTVARSPTSLSRHNTDAHRGKRRMLVGSAGGHVLRVPNVTQVDCVLSGPTGMRRAGYAAGTRSQLGITARIASYEWFWPPRALDSGGAGSVIRSRSRRSINGATFGLRHLACGPAWGRNPAFRTHLSPANGRYPWCRGCATSSPGS